MEASFYREQEIARMPGFLPAAQPRALTANAFWQVPAVPIRARQYMAVLDVEEFIFVDSQNKV